MELSINNENKTFESVTSLEHLMRQLGYNGARGIAAAVEEEVVPRGRWKEFTLRDGHHITIITAVQGG